MEEAPLRNDLAEGPDGGRAVWATASDGVRLAARLWMPEDADMYRVLYGDLHLEDVSPEDIQGKLNK